MKVTETEFSGAVKVNIQEKKDLAFKNFKSVIEIFDENNIDYWIEYGTLLGAVREKDIIPWDSEFDVGIWDEDYKKYKEVLLEKFNELGFNINNKEKDRVKLHHKDIKIGVYTIDIHTYHKKDDIAYVSFNKKKNSLFNRSLYNIHRAFSMTDDRKDPIYKMGPIIKTIMKKQDLPQDFIFMPGKFMFYKSFKLIVEGEKIDQDEDYFNDIGVTGKIGLNLVQQIPDRIRYKITDYLERKVDNIPRTNDIQALPIDFFENLTKLSFGSILVSCPQEYVTYVKSVYGENWNVRNDKWQRSQNKINRVLK